DGERLQGLPRRTRRQRFDLVLDQRRELEHLGVFEVAYDLAVLHRLGVIDADVVDELRETRGIGPCAGYGHREQSEHGEQTRVVQHRADPWAKPGNGIAYYSRSQTLHMYLFSIIANY